MSSRSRRLLFGMGRGPRLKRWRLTMSQIDALFPLLGQSADSQTASAMERFVREAPDRALHRVNPLAFAREFGLDEERAIAGFLHATRLGMFEMSWNVLCPSCGGVLDA